MIRRFGSPAYGVASLAFLMGTSVACTKVEHATLGSSDPCADAAEPAADLFASTAIDDFSVDGDTVYVSERPDPGHLESVLSRVSMLAAQHRAPIEIARVRSATRIAVTSASLYYEEITDGESRLLFRIPKNGGPPERVRLPSEEAPAFIETNLSADAAGNVFGVRVFGGHEGLVRVRPDGTALRLEPDPTPDDGATWSVSMPFVVGAGEVFAVATRHEPGSSAGSAGHTSVVGLSLDDGGAPRTILDVGDAALDAVALAVDDANVYIGKTGSVTAVPIHGGPTSALALPAGITPWGLVFAGGFLYADFENTARPFEAGFGRLPTEGGAIEPLPDEQPLKIVASGCYVITKTNVGLHARRR